MTEHTINTLAELEQLLHGVKPLTERHLGEILVREGNISDTQLQRSLEIQHQKPGKHLGEILIESGLCSQEQIIGALAEKLGIPFIRLGKLEISPAVVAMVPADIALQYSVLPIAEHNGRLIVAMEDPLNSKALDLLRFHTNRSIEPVFISHGELSRTLASHYLDYGEEELDGLGDVLPLSGNTRLNDASEVHNVAQEASARPMVRLVNALLTQGIAHRASDINIRPNRDRINVYYRIDGKQQFFRSFHISLLPAMVSRIKILGHMDIAERRLPQDGHVRVIRNDNTIDLRVSVIPTVNGESVVIRILDKQAGLKSLGQLGLHEAESLQLRQMTNRNHGMFLVTGPTGSGKTTTLYALLQDTRKDERHIITVEDPVEYAMENIEQIQILPATGYTFAEALRHILRHAPDVIMVGEIRDEETAEIANKAALTGHLVFSTLHTNDAASTITRLIDMGVEPYLLSSTLLGVMAQRLVRKLCPYCKELHPVDAQIASALQLDSGESFYRARGCASCNNSGYLGRLAVCELLEVTPLIAAEIYAGSHSQRIKALAQQQGMTTLTQNAITLAREGQTSIEEVFAVRLE